MNCVCFWPSFYKIFFKVALSIDSLRLVEKLSPSAVFNFLSGYVGKLMESLQFYS